MKKLAVMGMVPLFAGMLFAQTETQTTTTTTKSWEGNLIDAGCYHTKVQNQQTSTTESGATVTKTETKVTTECPVTTTTTEFGVVEPSGTVVRFDQPSSERVVEMVRKEHKWNSFITEKKPINVHIVGVPNGEYIVVREIK